VASEELNAADNKLSQQTNPLIDSDVVCMGRRRASVVIRTLNEAKYLDELLTGIRNQRAPDLDTEVIIVDSGSTDDTLVIAKKHGCKIVHIKREEFSFGRSLNRGCESAQGEIIIITSGHCVPASEHWLHNLCQPLFKGVAQYSYGRQLGGPKSYFSECRVFEKYFPDVSRLPQEGFYCNNANSAILKSTWQQYQFDEELTGLEDMALAQRLVKQGGKVAYVAEAPVYHHHSETWSQVKRRFEREAIALQHIMPHVHVGQLDALRYTVSSIWLDLKNATKSKQLRGNLIAIIRYRFCQYTGSYLGHQQHRKLSQAEKDQYFYPN
jgi:rhamnosyltransferase